MIGSTLCRGILSIHRQAGGQVIVAAKLADGRVVRVCGGRGKYGRTEAERGMSKWLAWDRLGSPSVPW